MTDRTPNPPRRPGERAAELRVLFAFGLSLAAGVAVLGLYLAGGQTQLEGLLLTVCLGGLGLGIVLWAQRLMSSDVRIEPRHPIGGDPRRVEELTDVITEEQGFTRRTVLIRALGGALAGLAAALAIPVLSLGPAPGRALFETSWRGGGHRLAQAGGEPIRPGDLPVGGVVTVFPDGDDDDANAATLLIHVEPELVPEEFVAYSKLCTHAGCPVGLYRAAQHILICPCHQSEFDVLQGGRPVSGPAARALPRLPIERQGEVFVATGDYPEPVGPSFWDMRL